MRHRSAVERFIGDAGQESAEVFRLEARRVREEVFAGDVAKGVDTARGGGIP